jgi:hypothetical protein
MTDPCARQSIWQLPSGTLSRCTPTASDVIVATYAKRGTNWALQIAPQIAYYGEAEYDFIHDLVAWPDAPVAPKIVNFILLSSHFQESIMRAGVSRRSSIRQRPLLSPVPFSPVAALSPVLPDPQSSRCFHPIGANLAPPDLLKSCRAIENSLTLLPQTREKE